MRVLAMVRHRLDGRGHRGLTELAGNKRSAWCLRRCRSDARCVHALRIGSVSAKSSTLDAPLPQA